MLSPPGGAWASFRISSANAADTGLHCDNHQVLQMTHQVT